MFLSAKRPCQQGGSTESYFKSQKCGASKIFMETWNSMNSKSYPFMKQSQLVLRTCMDFIGVGRDDYLGLLYKSTPLFVKWYAPTGHDYNWDDDYKPKIDPNAFNLKGVVDYCLLRIITYLDIIHLSKTSTRMKSLVHECLDILNANVFEPIDAFIEESAYISHPSPRSSHFV